MLSAKVAADVDTDAHHKLNWVAKIIEVLRQHDVNKLTMNLVNNKKTEGRKELCDYVLTHEDMTYSTSRGQVVQSIFTSSEDCCC